MHRRGPQNLIGVMVVFVMLLVPSGIGNVQGRSTESIQPINLSVPLGDITRVELGTHTSSFDSTGTQFDLEAKDGRLTDGKVDAPVWVLGSLLSGLKGMYPGTHDLTWLHWTDDYPHAWVYLHLKDGRVIRISSDSQYEGLFPWNVSIWASDQAVQADAVYIQLQTSLLNGINALWQGIGEKSSPIRHYDVKWMKEILGDPLPETVQFYIPKYSGSFQDGSAVVPIWGTKTGALDAFLPLLRQNPEIKKLLDAGYTPYDAAFAIEVQLSSLLPVQYSGTLALATPNRVDAVVGTVTIPLAGDQPVTTTFVAEDAMRLVADRRASAFLNRAAQMLSPLTFLLDTRNGIDALVMDCPKDPTVSEYVGQAREAIWETANPQRVTFYPVSNQRWTVDLSLMRGSPEWQDELVQRILEAWFPAEIAAIPISELTSLQTNWSVAFQPGVTLQDPGLLNRLKAQLPEQVAVHAQDPEKDGDFSFLSLQGRVVLSENGDSPSVTYCGKSLPTWYGPEYPIESVKTPDDQAPRQDIYGGEVSIVWAKANNFLYSLSGNLPGGDTRMFWTSITFSQPGFLHVFWSVEGSGVYYADGWINGTGWTAPQRLGDAAFSGQMVAYPDGEIHLFWDAGLRTGGTIHVWRPAGGTWQKPEHWPDIGYFTNIVRDSTGVLHLGYIGNDGLDSEFMHQTWSPEKGLSTPENVSRHIGAIGNTTPIFRLDSKGQLHAAWSHLLDQKSAPDPITGETSDIAGVFYAYQLPDGNWSRPELVGTLAPYAHALSMELDLQDNPVVIWQADDGLVSSTQYYGVWLPFNHLATVAPPETPAEFGSGRAVQPTAELKSGVNSQGQIIVGWLIPQVGLKIALWSGVQWSDPIDIVSAEGASDLEEYTLQMTVDSLDRVNFAYFKGMSLYYGVYDHQSISTVPLPMSYTGYGLPEASLVVDTQGSIAILGLPRSPQISIKLGPKAVLRTPTPAPTQTLTPTQTLIPTATLQPTTTLVNSPTTFPTPTLLPSGPDHATSGRYVIGVGALLALILIGFVVIRGLKRKGV